MLSMMPWIRWTSLVGVDAVQVRRHLVQAGDLAHQVPDRPHLLHLDDLLAEVVEVELPLGQPLLLALGLLGVDGLLGRLDQADDVAHAQHLADQPLGVERLELVELLPLADELDRHAGDLPDGQGRAAAGVAVELGQDHAVELEGLVEGLGRGHRVLAGHGVADEEDLVRLDLLLDLDQLGHQLVVDVQAAGGVEDQGVAALPVGLDEGVLADLRPGSSSPR